MKFDVLKLGWNPLAPRRRVFVVTGAVASCLAVAMFAGIGAKALPPASSAASVTLQGTTIECSEDANQYIVKLAMPDDARLSVRMEGNTLHIGPGENAGSAVFEQSLMLAEADTAQRPTFDRQNGKLVVTVPKVAPQPQRSLSPGISANPAPMPPFPATGMDARQWQVFGQFRRMQRQMEAMMDQAMASFGGAQPLASLSGLGSGVNIQDDGKNYVIRANVPGSTPGNVDVSVDDDRVLKISSKDESGGANRYQMSHFTQVLTLPGPVQSDKIQIEQEQDGLVIKLPKAS